MTGRLFDCVVIGGGIAGLMTARELALAGRKTAIIDRKAMGQECSRAGGGILSPLTPWRETGVLTGLIRFSQLHYPALAGELLAATGTDPEYWRCGMVMFGVDAEERRQADKWASKTGAALEHLDARGLKALALPVPAHLTEAIHLPAIAQIRNPKLITALRRDLLRLGVELIEHAEVTRINIQQGKVRDIETAQGKYCAGTTVLAGGAWSQDLMPGLDVKPIRGQMICYQAPVDYLDHILLKDDIYLIPRRDGHILAGSTLEDVGYDAGVTTGAGELLAAAAEEMLPEINRFPLVGHWAGLRPATRSGLPYICAHPGVRGLFLNTGHFRNGLLLAPGAARLIADLVLEREPVVAPAPFQYRPAGAKNNLG